MPSAAQSYHLTVAAVAFAFLHERDSKSNASRDTADKQSETRDESTRPADAAP